MVGFGLVEEGLGGVFVDEPLGLPSAGEETGEDGTVVGGPTGLPDEGPVLGQGVQGGKPQTKHWAGGVTGPLGLPDAGGITGEDGTVVGGPTGVPDAGTLGLLIRSLASSKTS